MACIYYIGEGKEGGRISRYRVFRGIKGGKVISIKAVLNL